MNSRRALLIGLGLVLIASAHLSLSAKDAVMSSAWATAAPAIDGVPDDWSGVPRGLDKSTRVEYAFRNDADDLFVLVIFKDPKFQGNLRTTGLTLLFSPEGSKDEERGVVFVQRMVNPDQLIAILEKQGQTFTEERKKELHGQASYLFYDTLVVDAKGKVLGPAVGTGPSLPPVFRVGRNGQEIAFEIRLPLAKREDHPGAIGTAPGQRLRVEFEWGGMTKAMRERMAAQVGDRGTRANEDEAEFDVGEVGGFEGRQEGGEPQSSLASMLRGPKKHSFRVDLTLASAAGNSPAPVAAGL
jgi:hypothetical protein